MSDRRCFIVSLPSLRSISSVLPQCRRYCLFAVSSIAVHTPYGECWEQLRDVMLCLLPRLMSVRSIRCVSFSVRDRLLWMSFARVLLKCSAVRVTDSMWRGEEEGSVMRGGRGVVEVRTRDCKQLSPIRVELFFPLTRAPHLHQPSMMCFLTSSEAAPIRHFELLQ